MTREAVVFKNPGLIEVISIKTLGINVKEGEDPFGYFGTGLKYAIGILLRSSCKITIWRGMEEFSFALKPVEVRGKDFSIVTMNGEELGFTSEIGKNWEIWMAYRELYCNTIDEDGDVFVSATPFVPQEGVTLIIVEGESFLNTHHKRREFILQSSPFETYKGVVEIHEGPAKGIFYKSIFIGGLTHTSKFTYNMLSEVQLTEDRTLVSLFSPEWEIVRAVTSSEDEYFIEAVATAGKDFFEGDFHFSYGVEKPSDVFLKTVEQLMKERNPNLNDSIKVLIRKHRKEDPPTQISLTSVQKIQLERAKNFSKKIGLFTEGAFPIIVVETLGKDILGEAKNEEIYLAIGAFEMGTKMVTITLIEEYIHLEHGHLDMTRSMQNFLFNKIVSLGEELNEEPL